MIKYPFFSSQIILLTNDHVRAVPLKCRRRRPPILKKKVAGGQPRGKRGGRTRTSLFFVELSDVGLKGLKWTKSGIFEKKRGSVEEKERDWSPRNEKKEGVGGGKFPRVDLPPIHFLFPENR